MEWARIVCFTTPNSPPPIKGAWPYFRRSLPVGLPIKYTETTSFLAGLFFIHTCVYCPVNGAEYPVVNFVVIPANVSGGQRALVCSLCLSL